ncbi:MAG: GNAT family N-acetyltransferase [Verrucomicrobia subdivision 3 bacterium]|nr:GNAT family N-acetyltransferase [Limisphaerales bacterium]
MVKIRSASRQDGNAIWAIFESVAATGDAFVFEADTPKEEALAFWFQAGSHAYVAENAGKVVGSYLIKPNQPGRGSHVANAAYMVAPTSRGLKIGREMGKHSLREAARLGFRAMQFNIVVSSNEPAVRLWQSLGFEIVGTLPGAFRHADKGFVDAYVMYRILDAA